MTALGFPRVPYAEFYLNSQWTNLINDIRQNPGILIERGKKNEASEPTPSRCSFIMDNGPDHGNGDYSSHNPLGQYYPHFGRNIPVRIGLELGVDNFTRTVGSGLGTSPDNGAWTVTGDGTSSVTSNTARSIISAVSDTQFARLADFLKRDVEIELTGSISGVANVTGGILAPWGLMVRHNGVNFYWFTIEISTAEVVTLRIYYYDGTANLLAGPITHDTAYSGQTWKVKFQADGSTLRGKAWVSTVDEPLDWDITVIDSQLSAPGAIGYTNATGGGNTNIPVTFIVDDFQIRDPRYTGETAKVTPGMSLSGKDKRVDIECGTVFRRLEQGNSPIRSPMLRTVPTVPGVFAYWPVEDGKFSTELAPGLTTHGPMRILSGSSSVKFAESDLFPGANRLPEIGTTEWRVVVPPHSATGSYQWRTLLFIPGGQSANAIFAVECSFTGSMWRWIVGLDQSDGSFYMQAYDGGGAVLVTTSGAVITDRPMYLQLSLTQNGADIDYELRFMELGLGPTATVYYSGTVAGQTMGRMIRFGTGSPGGVIALGFPGPVGAVLGHISIGNSIQALTAAHLYFNGYPGDTVTERAERLITETGIPPMAESDANSISAFMGPQSTDRLTNLLIEGANTDQGYFGESRGANGFAYKPIEYLYKPIPFVTLDHDEGHLAPDFIPTDDDFAIRNDITVKARRGSEAQAERLTGPNNVNDPGTTEGAVGRYDSSATTNPYTQQQISDEANWLVHLGTVAEPRFPEIKVDLGAEPFKSDLDLTYSILDLNVGDVLGLENLQQWDIYDDFKEYVLGYTELLNTAYVHTIAFNASPASPYHVGQLSDAFTATGQGTAINNSYIIATDADALDIKTGMQVYLKLASGALKESTIFTVARKESSVGFTNIFFTPDAASTTDLGDYIEVVDSLRLDSVTHTLNEDLDTTETGVTVTSSDGTLWTTVTAEYPFDLMVGGERIRATSCTGAANPQSFTVVRSINGVVKEHSTGDSISLADPYYLGL